jgi:hypothetical protein
MADPTDVDAARSRVNAMLLARPEAAGDAEEEGDPLATRTYFRRIQDTFAQGPHAALSDVIAANNPAMNDAVIYHRIERMESRLMDRIVKIEENSAPPPSTKRKKKKTDPHFSRSEISGLVMRFPRPGGGEAHMVIDGVWERVDADEPGLVVRGDVVQQLAARGEEESTLWQRVLPAEHIEVAQFAPDMVFDWEHREQAAVRDLCRRARFWVDNLRCNVRFAFALRSSLGRSSPGSSS